MPRIATLAAWIVLGTISLYAAVVFFPLFLLVVLFGLLITAPSWIQHPLASCRWIKNEIRKTWWPTPEEVAQQMEEVETRRKADELASWEARGALDSKTRPVSEWQPPHGAACRCELCSAYWLGWRTGL